MGAMRGPMGTAGIMALILAIAAFVAAGASHSRIPTSPGRSERANAPADPVALIELDAGMNRDGSSGPVLAIWNDGTVIFAFHEGSAGKNLQIGTVPPERIVAAMTEIAATGIMECELDWNIVPDGSCYTLAIWKDGKLRFNRWNEAMTVPWGVHIKTDAAHAKLAKAWVSARAILALTCPDEYEALDPKSPEASRLEALSASLRNKPIR